MNTQLPYSLETALEDSESGPQELSPAFFPNLADRLEGALAEHSREPLTKLSAQLVQLFNVHFRKAPPSVRDAALAKNTGPTEVVQAFNLGQIGFAQIFAAQATERRAADDFVHLLGQSALIPYLNALSDKELTCQELADTTKLQPETVSRRLKQLRELGVTDYRKDGRLVYNFLTPAARSVLPTVIGSQTQHDAESTSSTISRVKQKHKDKLEDHLQAPMMFIRQTDTDVAMQSQLHD